MKAAQRIRRTKQKPRRSGGVELQLKEGFINRRLPSGWLARSIEREIHGIYGSFVSVSVNFTATPSLVSYCSMRTITPRHLTITLPSGLLISSEKLI